MVLTAKDLDAIKELIEVTLDEKLEEKLNEKLKSFPSKDEFFSRMDEIISELKSMREEKDVLSHQVARHEERVSVLEKAITSP